MISIFAKPAFLNVNPHNPFRLEDYKGRGHLMRVSSMIRGDQVANQIGANLNPKAGYQDDVCIYVKPHLKKSNMTFNFEGDAYIDIIDGHNLGHAAHNYPDVKVITCSKNDFQIMSKELKNEVINIPQHHCNFDRLKKKIGEIKKIGVVGTKKSFEHLPKRLQIGLKEIGIELVKFSEFFQRQDIINFYKDVDIQIVWRPYKKILSNPLKIVNGMAFGVPTIALDEPAFYELDGYYSPIDSLDEFFTKLSYFINNPNSYKELSEKCVEKSEDYHIETVAELYKELDR